MEYKKKMQTVVEMPSYLKAAEGILSAAEREDIVAMLAADPECGEVIQGTGGFRKVRVARGGMGKRGGARVVYILHDEHFPIFILTAFAKNEKENLTMQERNQLAKRAKEIFATYRSK